MSLHVTSLPGLLLRYCTVSKKLESEQPGNEASEETNNRDPDSYIIDAYHVYKVSNFSLTYAWISGRALAASTPSPNTALLHTSSSPSPREFTKRG